MTEAIKAFPLQWPVGWKRTPEANRKRGLFIRTERQYSSTPGASSYLAKKQMTVDKSLERIRDELRRMGIHLDAVDFIVSTNIPTRRDGLPRSDRGEPMDPGVAVYWKDNTVDGWPQRCMAVDRYDRVADNLAAVAATLEAMRAIERHGGAEILDRAFTGFTALPAPITGQKPWREVIGVAFDESDPVRIRECYRIQRSKAHPDKGGTDAAYQAVERAYEQAAREVGFNP